MGKGRDGSPSPKACTVEPGDCGFEKAGGVKGKASDGDQYVFPCPATHRPRTDAALGLGWSDHFSSLLLSASPLATAVELALLGGVSLLGSGYLGAPPDVGGSMPLWELGLYFWAGMVLTRLYNSYLEACYFACPQYRTQPPREHKLSERKDLCGRELKQLETMQFQDKRTMASQWCLNLGLYFLLPGYYPAWAETTAPLHERALTVLLNHYVMSFGMYWAHRACHNNPWLWRNVHSLHHWAKHPLSRNTYEDHWLDNFTMAIVGHFFAQVLVPLDYGAFWFSHLFRVCESLEKHSGISCNLNLAHALQRWLPFAQMPHHHDWHHEGHKGCNYAFSSVGGLWDLVFATRKAGRAALCKEEDHKVDWDTREDRAERAAGPKRGKTKSILDHAVLSLVPVGLIAALVARKLARDDFLVGAAALA